MPSFIVKAQPDRDLYLLWSTIVDAPTAVGTRAQIEQALDPGERGADRFERADATGSSHREPGYGQWGEDGLVSREQGLGLLPRAQFTEAAERLLVDQNASLEDLLEPFEGEP